jgi:hypothetical protein
MPNETQNQGRSKPTRADPQASERTTRPQMTWHEFAIEAGRLIGRRIAERMEQKDRETRVKD